MSKLITKIVDIKKGEIKKGKNAGRPFYTVTIGNGEKFFAWSWNAIKDIVKGQEAELEIQKAPNVDYTQIVSSLPVIHVDNGDAETEETFSPEDDEGEGKVEVTEEIRRPFTVRPKHGDNNPYITRMSCIKSAIEFFSLSGNSGAVVSNGVSVEEVLDVASQFEAYINA